MTDRAEPELLEEARALLDAAFEGEFDDDDWRHTIGGAHVIVSEDGNVVSHASVVPRAIEVDGRTFAAGYVEGVATIPERQRQGFGGLALARATELVREHHELGVLSTGEHGFYERFGWERWAGPSYVRRDGGLMRSAEDDDGLMVLRFGPSAAVDPTASIACEDRPGDAW